MQEPNSAEFLLWELKENQRTKREWDAWVEAGSDPAAGERINDEQCQRIAEARARMKNGGLAYADERLTLEQVVALREGLSAYAAHFGALQRAALIEPVEFHLRGGVRGGGMAG